MHNNLIKELCPFHISPPNAVGGKPIVCHRFEIFILSHTDVALRKSCNNLIELHFSNDDKVL